MMMCDGCMRQVILNANTNSGEIGDMLLEETSLHAIYLPLPHDARQQ
jgi:hypothetical protein